MNGGLLSLDRLIRAIAWYCGAGLAWYIALKTRDPLTYIAASAILGSALGCIGDKTLLGTVVGVGFMAILLVMRAVEYPFQWLYCIVGIPWLGSILALYYDRVKIGIGLFAGFVVFYLVMLPGI